MGFNKGERKQSRADVENQMRETNRKAAAEEAYLAQQRAQSEADMAKFLPFQQRAMQRIEGLDTGKDISSIYPGIAGITGDVARQLKATNRMPAILGKDPRFSAKLQGARQGDVSTKLGELLINAAQQQRANDWNESLGLQNMRSSERQFGAGTFNQLMGTAEQLFGQASNKRQQAMQQAQMSFNQLMSGINAVSNVATGGIGAYASVKSIPKPPQ